MKTAFWTPERHRFLREMLADGKSNVTVSRNLGCSPTTVGDEIEKLGLRPRAARRPSGLKGAKALHMAGAAASSEHAREEDEMRVVRLPKLAFLSHRLSWE